MNLQYTYSGRLACSAVSSVDFNPMYCFTEDRKGVSVHIDENSFPLPEKWLLTIMICDSKDEYGTNPAWKSKSTARQAVGGKLRSRRASLTRAVITRYKPRQYMPVFFRFPKDEEWAT